MNPWFAIARDTARLNVESQNVVALRLFRLAQGGKAGRKEAHRMVAEKADALVQAQATIMSYLDIFWVLGVMAIVVAPVVLLLPRVPKGTAAAH